MFSMSWIRFISDASLAPRPAFFAIPGNHDYYSGGGGFYHTIDTVNSGIANCAQQASYFCLRTDDDKWQFLGMDTGFNDRVPTGQLTDPEGPDLHEDEYDWHKDKLETFTGSTILLSHHQLISAKEQLSTERYPISTTNSTRNSASISIALQRGTGATNTISSCSKTT